MWSWLFSSRNLRSQTLSDRYCVPFLKLWTHYIIGLDWINWTDVWSRVRFCRACLWRVMIINIYNYDTIKKGAVYIYRACMHFSKVRVKSILWTNVSVIIKQLCKTYMYPCIGCGLPVGFEVQFIPYPSVSRAWNLVEYRKMCFSYILESDFAVFQGSWACVSSGTLACSRTSSCILSRVFSDQRKGGWKVLNGLAVVLSANCHINLGARDVFLKNFIG